MQRYTVYFIWKLFYNVSRGTSNHHHKSKQLYLQHLVFVTPLLLPAASGRQPQTYVKPEASITVFELLMMSGVSLETC